VGGKFLQAIAEIRVVESFRSGTAVNCKWYGRKKLVQEYVHKRMPKILAESFGYSAKPQATT